MLFKLALRNTIRSFKSYFIYLVTITICFSLIFSFQLMAFSEDILSLSSTFQNFQYAVIGISIALALVLGGLIYYITSLAFRKRSKEFGTYMVLGMENKKIVSLFLIENLLLQTCSLILGIFIGFYLYQIMTAIVMHIFSAPYQLHIIFSLKAIGLTLLYFVSILISTLLLFRHKIKKMRIYDLLYANKRNEKKPSLQKKGQLVLFVASIFFVILGLLILRNGAEVGVDIYMGRILLGILCLIGGIYIFYFSVSSFLFTLLKNKKIHYHETNLFFLRNITSKIKSNRFLFGTLGFLVTFTFAFIGIGNTTNELFKTEQKFTAPADFNFYQHGKNANFDRYMTYVKDHFTIEGEVRYQSYCIDDTEFSKQLENTNYDQRSECFVALTDYNRVMKLLGNKEVSLQGNQFLIGSMYRGMDHKLEELGINTISIEDQVLALKEVRMDLFSYNIYRHIMVVPDHIIETLQDYDIFEYQMVNVKEPTTEQDQNVLREMIEPIIFENGVEYVPIGEIMVKGGLEAQAKGLYTIVTFSVYYVAIVFLCAVLTILAVQQLNDSIEHKNRYQLLKKMGLSQGKIDLIVLKQLLLYFFLPTVLPILISFFLSHILNQIFDLLLPITVSTLSIFLSGIGIFGVLYLIYFILTYTMFLRNIEEK